MYFNVSNARALLPGVNTLEEWESWYENPSVYSEITTPYFLKFVSKITARRMSTGVKYANEVALSLVEHWEPEAVVFTSRHGELGRAEKLLTQLSQKEPLSPTDFIMSVHNSAAGSFTIAKKLTAPSSSIASGADSFIVGLLETISFLSNGYQRVLLVDFDSTLSPFFAQTFPANIPNVNYAVAFAIENVATTLPRYGMQMKIHFDYKELWEPSIPVSLAFYVHWLKKSSTFVLKGNHATLEGAWV